MANDATPIRTAKTATSSDGSEPDRRHIQVGYLLAAIGAILFSTKAVAIKFAYQDHVDAETLLALRMGLATPFYLVIGAHAVRDRRRVDKPVPAGRRIVAAGAVGLLGYWVASYLDFLGLEYVSAQVERLILFTYPILVVIFGELVFGRPIPRKPLSA